MSKGFLFLMYHELQEAGRELCESDPGYVRYVATADEFREHLAMLKANNWRGLNVTESLALIMGNGEPAERGVCLTFDDGCATDLLVAAPLLKERGWNATFYITVDHLGRRGYLTEIQLRELGNLGFEIGSHSMNHRYLDDLGLEDLRVEIVESKKRLEQITGQAVTHFSCPGGRVNSSVTQVARDAGYNSVATSRVGTNRDSADRFSLSRMAVKRGTTAAKLERLCRGEGLFLSQAQNVVLAGAKRVLGNSTYERLRSTMLREG
jgi:peptidoglycan/xylan/chitin deacetylase (PgdA/CDA1 family)